MATAFGILALVMWSTLALLGLNTQGIPPFQLLTICFGVSMLVGLLRRVLQKKPLFEGPKLTARLWLIGMIGLFGFHFCYFMALRFAPVIQVSLIAYLWPLLLGIMVAPKNQRNVALAGGCFGFLGAALVITDGTLGKLESTHLIGYGLALLCALIWSSYSYLLASSPGDVDNITWISAGVALLSLAVHLTVESSYWTFSTDELLSLLLLGLGPVGGAFYLWDVAMKKGDKQALAALSFATPVLSAMVLFVADVAELSSYIVASLICIVTGMLVTKYGGQVFPSGLNKGVKNG